MQLQQGKFLKPKRERRLKKNSYVLLFIIYIKPKKADSIRKVIGIPQEQKFASLLDFFTDDFKYKLDPYLEEASAVKSQTGIQKEFLETNQRVNLLSNAIEGRSLKIFPVPEDENNT